MYLTRRLFGEILPFKMDPRRNNVALKGGLAHHDEFSEADRCVLFQTDDGRLNARVTYADRVPEWLYSPCYGSAKWFHEVDLQLRAITPDGYKYDFEVRLVDAPDFFLNEAGRPEPHPPNSEDDASLTSFVVEVTENRWWASDERSYGYEWHFAVSDLPNLPSLRASELCQTVSTPGVYPGAYFTCILNGPMPGYTAGPVEYWFSYELESTIDRLASFRDSKMSVIENHQYRFSFGRTDKRELDLNEGNRLVGLWEYLLGFCSGTFRAADIVIAYGDTGGWCYAELPRPLPLSLHSRSCWFPTGWQMDFPAFARQFMTSFQPDYVKDRNNGGVPSSFYDTAFRLRQGPGTPIPVLDGYLRAAALELPHDGLNASFSILETLAKEYSQRKRVKPGDVGNYLRGLGIPPIGRHRSFGSYQNGAWVSPRDIEGLKERPEGARSWLLEPVYKESPRPPDTDDEEYGITGIKAWRDKRASHFDGQAGGGMFYDIQNYSQLALEYLELVILRQIDYTGYYRSRTGMFYEAVKEVSWLQDVSDKLLTEDVAPE